MCRLVKISKKSQEVLREKTENNLPPNPKEKKDEPRKAVYVEDERRLTGAVECLRLLVGKMVEEFEELRALHFRLKHDLTPWCVSRGPESAPPP